MRTRLAALTLGLYLSFVMLGCNSKPADSTASNSNDSNAPAAPNNNAAGSGSSSAGSGMSNSNPGSGMSNMKSEPKA